MVNPRDIAWNTEEEERMVNLRGIAGNSEGRMGEPQKYGWELRRREKKMVNPEI